MQELERAMGSPGFWDDSRAAQEVVRELSAIRRWVERWQSLRGQEENLVTLDELARDAEESGEDGSELLPEMEKEVRVFSEAVDRLELEGLMQGEDDPRGAILTIHAGAGGTESQDWAQMLMRMYLRWAEQSGYRMEELDLQEGDEAGIRSATFSVEGDYAFGYLKAETGVHRLVRISPFDASKRRHTSFASVFVYSEAGEDLEVEIKESDVRVDTYRASGAGGQHVNKTSSAVRLTHIPSGIVVTCQNERSQHRNRDNAFKVLRARLHDLMKQEMERERAAQEPVKKEIAWGSQIRSYVFQPYTLVKDHRTDVEIGDVNRVMDGGIDPFIQAYLRTTAAARSAAGRSAGSNGADAERRAS
jgi:peptide chain release factor 2